MPPLGVLSNSGMEQLHSKLEEGCVGLDLLMNLEIEYRTDITPKERVITNEKNEVVYGEREETLVRQLDGKLISKKLVTWGPLFEPLTEQAIEEGKMLLDFKLRFNGQIHSSSTIPPLPSLRIKLEDLQMLKEECKLGGAIDLPAGQGKANQGPQKPHTHFVNHSRNNGLKRREAWESLKEFAKQSKGSQQIFIPGYQAHLYLKLHRGDFKRILYKQTAFEGPNDAMAESFTLSAFNSAWSKAGKH